jgi:hypothetical protein
MKPFIVAIKRISSSWFTNGKEESKQNLREYRGGLLPCRWYAACVELSSSWYWCAICLWWALMSKMRDEHPERTGKLLIWYALGITLGHEPMHTYFAAVGNYSSHPRGNRTPSWRHNCSHGMHCKWSWRNGWCRLWIRCNNPWKGPSE